MGFFDEIGDFFQDNIINLVKKVTRSVARALPEQLHQVVGPALLAVPGAGPALAGIWETSRVVGPSPTRGRSTSPIATPPIVPWQSGGIPATLPPSVPGAFQAAQMGSAPAFLPGTPGGFSPGTGGYSPMSGRVVGAQLRPNTPFVNMQVNPYLPPTTARAPIPVYIVPGPGRY